MESNQSVKGKRNIKKKLSAPLGAVLIILVIVGLISTIIFSINTVKSIIDNSAKKREFEQFVYPVVMFDPIPFSSLDKADMSMLIQSSLWYTLINNRSKYQYDDEGLMIVPATDVEMSGVKLYGKELKLSHQSFGDVGAMFIYDEELKSYHVPVTAIMVQYVPKVTEIKRSGDIYTLTVTYIPPASILDETDTGTNTGVKKMIYTLRKEKKSYYILSITDMPGNIMSSAQPPVMSEDITSEPDDITSSDATSDSTSDVTSSGSVSSVTTSSK